VLRRMLLPWLFALLACRGDLPDETVLFFDPGVLHEVELTIDPALFPTLDSRGEERISADITFDGERVTNIGIRLKGGFGSVIGQTMTGGKPGFSIKTNEFIQGQKILGVKKFTLDNAVQDPSFLSAHLGHEIFRRAGVPSSRTAYARVSVNGEYFGVYLIVESFNSDFLEKNFPDGTGNLYEGPGDIINVEGIDLDSNAELNDRSDLEAIREVILNSPNDQFVAAISQRVDLDAFLRYWAVEALAYHWDGYATFDSPFGPCCSPNNYNAYHDPSLGKLYFMPHGIDSLFLDVTEEVMNPPSPGSSLPTRLFVHPEIRQRLADKIRLVLQDAWDTGALEARLDAAITLIRPAVLEFDRNPNFNAANFEAAIESVRGFILQRPQAALDQLTQGGF
jgi:spore coat protein H